MKGFSVTNDTVCVNNLDSNESVVVDTRDWESAKLIVAASYDYEQDSWNKVSTIKAVRFVTQLPLHEAMLLAEAAKFVLRQELVKND
jgi:ribosomal protein L7/L12